MIKAIKQFIEDYKILKKCKNIKNKTTKIKDEKLLAMYAKQLIDNPLYKHVINEIEEDLTNMWKATNVADMEERERIYTMLRACLKLDARIKYYASLINKYAPTTKSGVQKEEDK